MEELITSLSSLTFKDAEDFQGRLRAIDSSELNHLDMNKIARRLRKFVDEERKRRKHEGKSGDSVGGVSIAGANATNLNVVDTANEPTAGNKDPVSTGETVVSPDSLGNAGNSGGALGENDATPDDAPVDRKKPRRKRKARSKTGGGDKIPQGNNKDIAKATVGAVKRPSAEQTHGEPVAAVINSPDNHIATAGENTSSLTSNAKPSKKKKKRSKPAVTSKNVEKDDPGKPVAVAGIASAKTGNATTATFATREPELNAQTKDESKPAKNDKAVKYNKPKRKSQKESSKPSRPVGSYSMYPELHSFIAAEFPLEDLAFHRQDNEDGMSDFYRTHIMGSFTCENPNCQGDSTWSSKKITIEIRMYDDERYNARIYHQGCIRCKAVARPMLDVECYTQRVVYRLKKWLNYEVETLPYYGGESTKPHIRSLCEACKLGHCDL